MKTYQRQVHGTRAKAKLVDNPNTPGDESKGNSVSHQSYVQVAEAFSLMVALLTAEPLYTPNEAYLTVATNTTLLADMEGANDDVINAVPAWKNSMASRNARLYLRKSLTRNGSCASSIITAALSFALALGGTSDGRDGFANDGSKFFGGS